MSSIRLSVTSQDGSVIESEAGDWIPSMEQGLCTVSRWSHGPFDPAEYPRQGARGLWENGINVRPRDIPAEVRAELAFALDEMVALL